MDKHAHALPEGEHGHHEHDKVDAEDDVRRDVGASEDGVVILHACGINYWKLVVSAAFTSDEGDAATCCGSGVRQAGAPVSCCAAGESLVPAGMHCDRRGMQCARGGMHCTRGGLHAMPQGTAGGGSAQR